MKQKLTKKLKIIRWYLCLILLGIQVLSAHAQESRHSVEGVVVNTSGAAVSGASIRELGGTNATRTDAEGRFTLDVSTPDATLQVSYVGYVAQEGPEGGVGGRSDVRIPLVETIEERDEVVVVGYGTQRKANVTGAISSVNMKELESRPVVNVVEALQGTTPGLTIQQSNSQPGSRPAI